MTLLRARTLSQPTPEWAALAREGGLFFHTPAWVNALASCFALRTAWLGVERDGAVEGVVPLAEVPALIGPRRLTSLPFSYAAGPVATSREGWEALGAAARELAGARRLRRIELKTVASSYPPPAEYVRVADRYATYRIPLTGDPWASLDRDSTQRSIRKGERHGVTVDRGRTVEEWLAMARLQERTARRHGLPPPPRRFFTDACRSLQDAGLADLWLARLRGGQLASGLVVWIGTRAWIYAFGASDPRTLAHRPNHVALWAVLREASAVGVQFDLGRAAPEQTGLVQFKRRWGGQPVPLTYDYWPDARGLNVAPRDRGPLAFAARAWSRLPTPLTRLGAGLYRYLG
jgi:hypothetical protein